MAGLGAADKFHFIMGEFSFISIILFNFMGFEVVGTWVDDMNEPKKDIPKALIFGGLLMALFYILPATGFNIALEANADWVGAGAEIVVDVLNALFAAVGLGANAMKTLVIIAGLMFIYTFIANIASWSFGVNEVAKYAADDGSMPKAFSKANDEGVPYMGAIINGVVASLIVIFGIVASAISEDFSAGFSLFFCLSWITLLIGYTPMFLAFIKLRREDKSTKRVYKAPIAAGVAWIPFVLLVLGILFTLFGDFSKEYILDYIPLFAGVLISFLAEELLVLKLGKGKDTSIVSGIFLLLSLFLVSITSGTSRIVMAIFAICFLALTILGFMDNGSKKKTKKKEE